MDFPDEDFSAQRRAAQAELMNITTQAQEVTVTSERVEDQVSGNVSLSLSSYTGSISQ